MGCNPFHQDRVMNYEDELQKLIKEIKEKNIQEIEVGNNNEISAIMRNLEIDEIYYNKDKNNSIFSGFVEESDSLIIFIKKSRNIANSEKRILFDTAKKPRNYGNDTIIGASYKLIQINDRWYFSTIGFD